MNAPHEDFAARRARIAIRTLRLRARAAWAVRQLPLDVCLARLTPSPRPRPPEREESAILSDVEAVTDLLLRRLPLIRAACLKRALVRFALLRSAGVPAEFVMGVGDGVRAERGHAWLELDGRAIMEPRPPDWTETFRFPPSAPR